MIPSRVVRGTVLAGIVVLGLPLAGHWARRHAEQGCALDGGKIQSIYRVEVVDDQEQRHSFCCLRCAQLWLRQQRLTPQAILVTDETTGQAIDAAAACYVRSSVVTTPTTGNRIHVFANRADAESHADRYSGSVLREEERPFR